MAVRCSKCGEQLLGAVNRCWKCGQPFDTPASAEDAAQANSPGPSAAAPSQPAASPFATTRPARSTAERIDAQRTGAMAMGGTVASFVLAAFALVIAPFRFEAALVGLLGLLMGIWGLYSPRRRLALLALLLCCLAIGLGSYTGIRQLYVLIQEKRAIHLE